MPKRVHIGSVSVDPPYPSHHELALFPGRSVHGPIARLCSLSCGDLLSWLKDTIRYCIDMDDNCLLIKPGDCLFDPS